MEGNGGYVRSNTELRLTPSSWTLDIVIGNCVHILNSSILPTGKVEKLTIVDDNWVDVSFFEDNKEGKKGQVDRVRK